MLTFITANGDCNPTVHQLAHAMQVTVPKVKSRMQRLISFQWQSEPLVIFLKRESGLDAYTVNAKLIAYEHTQESVPQPSANAPAMVAGGREAVIAYSREHYTKPRVEVEQMIEEQLRPTPVSTEAVIDESKDHEIGAIKHHLMRVGVSPEQADYLLSHFDRVRIQRQLQWLPYRHARNQAGFLIVAIEDNYEAPLALRPRVKSRDVEERIGESLEVNQSSAGGAPSDPQSLKEIAPERVGDLAETGTSTGVSDPINR